MRSGGHNCIDGQSNSMRGAGNTNIHDQAVELIIWPNLKSTFPSLNTLIKQYVTQVRMSFSGTAAVPVSLFHLRGISPSISRWLDIPT
jgi:hypothetical protein